MCPFCPGCEADEEEVYRVPLNDSSKDWLIRVVPNKFPFTPHHEIVIHSPDHHKNIDELPFEQVELIFQTYKNRFQVHHNQGQVYIFHNRGHQAGESVHHPHTQITVVPKNIKLDILPLDTKIYSKKYDFCGTPEGEGSIVETEHFFVFCPPTSEWPDEVWVAPKQKNNYFGQITDKEITDLAFVVTRLIQIFDIRHGSEFPFNFYIAPERNWYLRLIPRLKVVGGFEVGTGIIVNTQDPKETCEFIKEHFWKPNAEKIRQEHSAKYREKV